MENEDQNAKVQLAADVVNHFWHLGIKTSESEMRTNSFSKNAEKEKSLNFLLN